MWVWIGIGVGGFLALSATVALVVARVLGTIASKISELQELDDWAMLPPSRSSEERERQPSDGGVRKRVA